MSVQEAYKKLEKKHKGLPPFARLNRAFEISRIEDTQFLLREIRRKIAERIEGSIKILEEVLQPEVNLTRLRESEAFSEEEKKEMFTFYRRCMMLNRWGWEIEIMGEDKLDVAFIVKTYTEWDNIKKTMQKILQKMREQWKGDLDIKSETWYLG